MALTMMPGPCSYPAEGATVITMLPAASVFTASWFSSAHCFSQRTIFSSFLEQRGISLIWRKNSKILLTFLSIDTLLTE